MSTKGPFLWCHPITLLCLLFLSQGSKFFFQLKMEYGNWAREFVDMTADTDDVPQYSALKVILGESHKILFC